MTELVVRKSVEINALDSKVWEILTNPAYTKQYMFDCELVSDWKIGSSVIWKGSTDGKVYGKGNLLKIKSNKFLEFTIFNPIMGFEDKPANHSTVTYELLSKLDRTKLTVSQGDFAAMTDGEKRYNDTSVRWDTVLPKIKKLAEQ
jgi:uncharacterized protein YndB with AHSA1/START domain